FVENDAGQRGGGAYLDGAPFYMTDTLFDANSAAEGGGIYFGPNGTGGGLHGAALRFNQAATGPDCVRGFRAGNGRVAPSNFYLDIGTAGVIPTIITDITDCDIVPSADTHRANMIPNGGFEIAADVAGRVIDETVPASWTLKKISGDKRICNDEAIPRVSDE